MNLPTDLKEEAQAILTNQRCFIVENFNGTKVCNLKNYYQLKNQGYSYVGETFDGETY